MEDYSGLFRAMEHKNLRKQRRLERAAFKGVLSSFDIQMKYISKEMKKQLKSSEKKAVEKILKNLPQKLLIATVLKGSKASLTLGANDIIDKLKLADIGINFNLSNPLAVEYIEKGKVLSLANMSNTTKDNLRPILLNAIETGQSHQKTMSIISDSFVFGRNRAKMIAVHELGDAYEEGNYIPMKDAQDDGNEVRKKWLTVGDDRVTPSHTANQSDGWIEFDDTFSGTGDERAPASDNPRCRCTTLYEIN